MKQIFTMKVDELKFKTNRKKSKNMHYIIFKFKL